MTDNRAKIKTGIKVRLFWPVGLGLLILLLGSSIILKKLQQNNLNYEVNEYAEHTSQLFQNELKHEAGDIEGLIDLIQMNQTLQQLWQKKDRQSLYDYTASFYGKFCSEEEITHYYFHDTNGVCFLRVHQPERYGDTINRYTMNQAIKTGQTAWGIELGPLGTFALRVVKPWRIDGKIQGYLELGRDLDHIVKRTTDLLGVELFFTINKEYLNRADWEKGMAMLDKQSNWDQFKQFVLASSTISELPEKLNAYLHSLEECESEEYLETMLIDVTSGENRFRGKPVCLTDGSGKDVGDIVVLVNTNTRERAIQRLSSILIIAYGVMFSLLCTILSIHFKKTKAHLNKTYADLNREIEDHKKSKKQIEQQNRFLNNVTESLSHPFYIVDVNTYQVTMANSAAKALNINPDSYCHTAKHKKGTPCGDTNDDCPVKIIKETHRPATVEHMYYDQHGNPKNLEVHCYPIFDIDGTLTHAIEYSLDVTERKKILEKLEKAKAKAEESNRLKSEFLANISHEIRTPLNSIIGFSELLVHESSLNTEQRDFSEIIFNNGHLLLTLIDSILDLSKIEAGKIQLEFSDLNLETLQKNLNSVIEPIADRKHVEFNIHIPKDLKEKIHTDQFRLQQCLLNLASNAVKFTPEGSVDIHFNMEENLGKKLLRIDVKDTGIGIPESKLESVFEPFIQADGSTTRKFGGTGLGLTITRKLITMLGGELYVDSKLGVGTVFSVHLPLQPPVNTGQQDENAEAETVSLENNTPA